MVNTLVFNTQFTLGRLPFWFRLRNLEEVLIHPHIRIFVENQNYEVKIVDCPKELVQVLRLRFEVFFNEFSSMRPWRLIPYDVDVHDFFCDHLIVKDKKDNKVIACYRLLTSELKAKAGRYYSEGEFDLTEFMKLPGGKLELGRACVHKDYRNGTVVGLLWKGLCQYARKSGTKYLFGCSSINGKDFANVPAILSHLEGKGAFLENVDVTVKGKYQKHPNLPATSSGESGGKAMGSLMHMYLLAGAKVGRRLAYDKEMDCLDMFMVMDFEALPESFRRKFA